MNTLEGMSARQFLLEQSKMCNSFEKNRDGCLHCDLYDPPVEMCRMDEIAYDVGTSYETEETVGYVINAVQTWINKQEHKTILEDYESKHPCIGYRIVVMGGEPKKIPRDYCPYEVGYEDVIDCPCIQKSIIGGVRDVDCYNCWNRKLEDVDRHHWIDKEDNEYHKELNKGEGEEK